MWFHSSVLFWQLLKEKQGAIAKTQTGFAPGSKYERNYLIQEYWRTLLCFQPVGWKSCRFSVCLGILFLQCPCLAVEIQCKSCIPQVLPWDRGLGELKLQTCSTFLHVSVEFPSWTFFETPKKASSVCSVSHNSLCRRYTPWSTQHGVLHVDTQGIKQEMRGVMVGENSCIVRSFGRTRHFCSTTV